VLQVLRVESKLYGFIIGERGKGLRRWEYERMLFRIFRRYIHKAACCESNFLWLRYM